MKYYRLLDDVEISGRWFLKGPTDLLGKPIDADLFSKGERVEFSRLLRYSLRRVGNSLDITFADFDVIVAGARASELLYALSPSSIQLIPVKLETEKSAGKEYAIINIIETVACLDESRSDILWWSANDGRPDKVGKYRMVTNISIKQELAKDHRIFRLSGWEVAIIVDELVKESLEQRRMSGVQFKEIGLT